MKHRVWAEYGNGLLLLIVVVFLVSLINQHDYEAAKSLALGGIYAEMWSARIYRKKRDKEKRGFDAVKLVADLEVLGMRISPCPPPGEWRAGPGTGSDDLSGA